MKKPKLSIVICTIKKRQKILETMCLPALQKQTFKDFELVIIKNKGLAEARNEGVRKAQSDFVAFIDDDAIPREDWIENVIKNLELAEGIAGKVIHPKNDIWKRMPRHYDQGNKRKSTDMMCGCNMAFRKSVFEGVGMFDEHFTWMHDEYDFLLRYLKKYTLTYVPDVVVEHLYAKNHGHYFKKRYLFGKKDLYLWKKHSKNLSILDIFKKMRPPGLTLTRLGLLYFIGQLSEDLGIGSSILEAKLQGIKRCFAAYRHKRHLKQISRSLRTGKGIFPRQVIIEPTNRCVSRCFFCQRWKVSPEDIKKELKTEEWKKIIRDCKKVGVEIIDFSGGEPFLRKDIWELISEAKKNKLQVYINTNGYFLPDAAEKIAEHNVDMVVVSIDSVNSAKHNMIRQTDGLWEKAVDGVSKLKKAGVNVAIGAVLIKDNLNEVNEFINFAKGLGVNFRFQPLHNDMHDLKPDDKEALFSIRDLGNLKKAAELMKKEKHSWVEKIYYMLLPDFLVDPKKILKIKCYLAGRLIYFINPFGDVFPCESRRDLKLGNTTEENFKKIIYSEKAKKVRKHLSSTERECVCWYRCIALGNITYQFSENSLPHIREYML